MHPTKREVGFLHQDELIQTVCSALGDQLLAGDSQCAPSFPTLAWSLQYGACQPLEQFVAA